MTDASRWERLDRPPLRAAALRRAVTADGPIGPGPGQWAALDVVGVTGSTNADLAARARAGTPVGVPDRSVLVADHQSAGRGRLGRVWTVPPRAAISVSVLLRPADGPVPVPQHVWGWLPLLAGVAVCDALRAVCGLDARLKWPNDVLVPGVGGDRDDSGPRKVCGVLAEVVQTPDGPAVVLGMGINVSQGEDELAVPTATSLLLAGSAVVDRDTVLRSVLRSLGEREAAWRGAGGDPRGSGIGAAYREACATLGHQVRVTLPAARGEAPQVIDGEAGEIDDDGRLVLHGPVGRTPLAAGDVTHVRPASGSW